MSIKQLFRPILGAGTLLTWRAGFSELSDEKRRPALIGLYHINQTFQGGGLTPLEILFALKPKAPI